MILVSKSGQGLMFHVRMRGQGKMILVRKSGQGVKIFVILAGQSLTSLDLCLITHPKALTRQSVYMSNHVGSPVVL